MFEGGLNINEPAEPVVFSFDMFNVVVVVPGTTVRTNEPSGNPLPPPVVVMICPTSTLEESVTVTTD